MATRKAPLVKTDAPGMAGPRGRNEDGQLRRKRGDTLVKTIEELHGVDLNARGDMRLDTLLKREGAESLSDVLEKAQGK